MKLPHEYNKRSVRKQQIQAILNSGWELTTWEIAKKLGLKPSSHLRQILCEMLRDGLIHAYAKQPGERRTFVWFIPTSQKLPGDF